MVIWVMDMVSKKAVHTRLRWMVIETDPYLDETHNPPILRHTGRKSIQT